MKLRGEENIGANKGHTLEKEGYEKEVEREDLERNRGATERKEGMKHRGAIYGEKRV